MTVNHHSIHARKRQGLLTPEKMAFADCERARGRSWGAICRMLGRSEHDIRSACDPEYGVPAR